MSAGFAPSANRDFVDGEMMRTTRKGREELAARAHAIGRKTAGSAAKRSEAILNRAAGMWKDRRDLPATLRAEWGRH